MTYFAIMFAIVLIFGVGLPIGLENINDYRRLKHRDAGLIKTPLWTAAALFISFTITTVSASFIMVDRREVAVVYEFTKPYDQYGQGIHWVPPWTDVRYTYNTGRLKKLYDGIALPTATNVEATGTVAIPFKINAERYGTRIYDKVGQTNDIINDVFVSAIMSASAEFDDSVINEKRDELSKRIIEIAKTKLIATYTNFGFSPTEAMDIITISTPNIGQLSFPPKVQNANNELAATERQKLAQDNLDEIAARQAKRQEEAGNGINNMLSKLPQSVQPKSVDEIATLITAISTLETAAALNKAVSEGDLNVAYISGNNPVSAK